MVISYNNLKENKDHQNKGIQCVTEKSYTRLNQPDYTFNDMQRKLILTVYVCISKK